MKVYFVRVNGLTLHDNPKIQDCFVAVEPKSFKRNGYSNYLSYSLENDIVRIGWPDVGDLTKRSKEGAKSNCYSFSTIKDYIREYLLAFRDIQPGSILIVPNREKSGDLYVSEVVKGYWYDTSGPYECAHRVGVRWDRNNKNQPIIYTSDQMGISKGGWWLRAFHEIKDQKVISRIAHARELSERLR